MSRREQGVVDSQWNEEETHGQMSTSNSNTYVCLKALSYTISSW